jgi:hypothetical protein
MVHTISDWLDFHNLKPETVERYLKTYGFDTTHDSPLGCVVMLDQALNNLPATLPETLELFIKPALSCAFTDRTRIAGLIDRLEFLPLDYPTLPYALDRGKGLIPAIAMDWSGSPHDLLCLAHECGHGLQIILSDHALMPPVGRETCAFVAELLLMAYVKDREPRLFHSLCRTWAQDNKLYLGSDVKLLRAALEDPETPYHYRMNYPLARLAAEAMFAVVEDKWADRLFSSGSHVMAMMPLHRKHPEARMDVVQSDPMAKSVHECAA